MYEQLLSLQSTGVISIASHSGHREVNSSYLSNMMQRLGRLHLMLGVMAAGERTNTKTIGDVMSEQLRGSSEHRKLESNKDILKAMLKKDFFDEKDECLDIVDGVAVYGECDISKFPYCQGDKPNICFNRINRQDKFWPDKNPYYYIDYKRIQCYPDRGHNVDFTCSSCSPGRWCMPEGRCILDEARYNCWSDPVADD